ncbi:MAG: DNA polymerase III subunit gamma/tau [Bryobacter sp.]|nr:DNA polymerase III subunit gamma/tau [Bryobacter sp.]
MYQVIARKYRPHEFDALIGQEHVKTTLDNAITQGRIAHGYIFAGQRGTGKTTVARIVARCLNCEQGPTANPCGKCASCLEVPQGNALDVIEIDAASNRGINEMRELRENVRFRPARDRFKVFIVDEAHQITNEAFNALLKTLEEPPEWAVFILCTTESHKIPTTIVSRCQQFNFRSVDFQQLVDRMRWICGQEGVETDEEALSVLALVGEGSVRDSLSALDQAIACCGQKLTGSEVRKLLGIFGLDSLGEVTEALLKQDAARMIEIVMELERSGQSLQHFCRELARYFRNLMVAKVAGADTRLIAASPGEVKKFVEVAGNFSEPDLLRYLQLTLDLFRDLQYSLQPRLHMEMGLVRMVQAGKLANLEEVLAGLPAPKAAPLMAANVAPRERANLVKPAAKKVEAAPSVPEVASTNADASLQQRIADKLLEARRKFSADAVLGAKLEEAGGTLRFLAPKLYVRPLQAKEVAGAVQAVLGRMPKIEVVEDNTVSLRAASPAAKADDEALRAKALADVAVLLYQETFPGATVRGVKDLSYLKPAAAEITEENEP